MIKFFLKNGSCLFALLAIATLAGNGGWLVRTIRGIEHLRSSWGERAYRGNGDHVDLPRQMVERHVSPGTSVYMVNIKSNELMSVERSRHLAVSWAMSPTPVRFGYDPSIGDAQAVLGCAYGPGPEFSSAGLDSAEFKKVDEGGGSALWMRTGACPPSSTTLCARSPTPAAWREVAGLLAPVSVIVGAVDDLGQSLPSGCLICCNVLKAKRYRIASRVEPLIPVDCMFNRCRQIPFRQESQHVTSF